MNSKSFYICIIVAIVCLCVMHCIMTYDDVAKDDNPTTESMLQNGDMKVNIDSKQLMGRIGDGTGMSCIEFVTSDNDTLLLNRTSEFTGQDGRMYGSIQTETDNLYVLKTCDNGESVDVLVNLTELRTKWHCGGRGFSLAADSTAQPLGAESPRYKRWSLNNGLLLLTREMRHEAGQTEVVDTFRIVSLSPDTLVICDHIGELQTFSSSQN